MVAMILGIVYTLKYWVEVKPKTVEDSIKEAVMKDTW